MSGKTDSDRKTLRRQASIDEILDAAWGLSRTNGLGNFSMRELGERVGMRAQSLYSYFGSKTEIFDAMFRQGNEQFVEALRTANDSLGDDTDPVTTATTMAETFVHFCTSDPIRYQLLFQRILPDFVPSDESYAVAIEAYELSTAGLRALGLDQQQLDLCTSVTSGIVAQQISNEPGGDRWVRLTRQAVTMLLRELAPDVVSIPAAPTTRRTT
jgi:AcrR family transcriptional regulator